MRKELDDLLCKRYPEIFVERHLPMEQTAMCWGFPEDGWFTLIDRLCAVIQDHLNNFPGIPQVVAKQVKEKFGGLRFYFDGGDEYIAGAVRAAEALSVRICEVCGTTANTGQTQSRWIYTRCKDCADKLPPEFLGQWKAWEKE